MKANKTFEQVLKELDKMMEEDFFKFKQELQKLSVRENTDNYFEPTENLSLDFENSKNCSNLADNNTHKETQENLNLFGSNENSRSNYYV
jgi:hypothetical protein